MFLNLSLSGVLLMIREGLWVWRKNTTEVMCHSHYITARVEEIQDTSGIKLNHLVKLVFARFLQCRFSLSMLDTLNAREYKPLSGVEDGN